MCTSGRRDCARMIFRLSLVHDPTHACLGERGRVLNCFFPVCFAVLCPVCVSLSLCAQLVLWLPALCRKMGVPYCVIKGKARLGQLVHQKTATCVALTSVADEHQANFNRLVESCTLSLPDAHARSHWGDGEMGQKSQNRTYKKERLLLAEELKRA